MKLKILLNVLDPFESITIHREGYPTITCKALYVDRNLFDYDVVEIASYYRPGLSGLFVWIEDPAELDDSPFLPSEVRND